MGYFKKFGDFCSGFCCFTALIYLFRQFMAYDPAQEEVGTLEKLKLFFEGAAHPERSMLLRLALLFAVSLLIGRIFSRFPHVSLLAAVPPLLLTVDMIKSSYIKEYPMLYVILGGISFVSGCCDCVGADKKYGGNKSAWGGNLLSICAALFCVYVLHTQATLDGADVLQMNYFEYEIYAQSQTMNMKLFTVFAAIYAVGVLLSLVLSDVYFLHAIVAAVPAAVLAYLWGADKLTVHPELMVAFGIVVLTARVIPAISARAVSGAHRGGSAADEKQ